MYEQRRPDVAVFIDFENVYVSVRDKLNANPNFEAIMDRCGDLGRVIISRAYADWYRYPRVTSALYANAIEPIYVATYYYDKDIGRTGRAIKNSVDMNLCIDAMKTLFTNPNISRYVLVTGDRDFIPLVNSIRQQGKEVYIIGIGGAASTHLAQSADEFVFYEQLIGKQPGGSAAATAIMSRGGEFSRNLDPVTDAPAYEREPSPRDREFTPREREPSPRDREFTPRERGYTPRERGYTPREREFTSREVAAELPPPPAVVPPAQPAPAADSDVYAILVEAIHLVRKRGYVSTLGSIKLVMKELMGGDFKESRYRDLNNRPFVKFKDFVLDAEKRGKVQIFTNGTVNEVFLPGEDPYKLSQFAAALTEEAPVEPVLDTAVLTNGRKESARAEVAAAEQAAATGRRRRRRSRRGQGGGHVPVNESELGADAPEFDEPDYTPPVGALVPPMAEDELGPLDEREAPAALYALFDDQHGDDLATAGLPADLLAEATALEETAAALGFDLPRDHEGFATAPDELAWDAAASAVAAEDAPPAEAAWDAAVSTVATQSIVEHAPVTLEEHATNEVTPEPDNAAEEDEVVSEPIDFSEGEWAIFSQLMRGFTKPASFQQIFDTLRGQRKEHNLTRTNEQLRTMVKQAINTGLIERSGRGKRVYYTLRAE